ncbi:hypothetical protein [Shimia sp. SDUM112013]|uniref:hypothetical protein n=1 Tax=Shimia sp. SDUM112013 TaxID=3136160 RepID=UPI0032ED8C24
MKTLIRFGAACLVAASLSACAVNKDYHTDAQVAQAAYVHDGPPRLTLFTMVSNETGSGAHTSLMVNASQRVAFDPAGNFRADQIVSKGDVVYGMTPERVDFYTRYHARKSFHVIVQELDVPPQTAELALRKVMTNGAVPQANCARSTSEILKSLPGFEDIPVTYYPNKLAEAFAKKGATSSALYEYDDDDKSKVLREYNAELVAKQQNG